MYQFSQAPQRFIGRLQDIIDVLSPEKHSFSGDQIITGFSIDSRTVRKGEVYVAIRGARVDGHDFIKAALDKGAIGCLVDSADIVDTYPNCFLVDDTVNALGYLAASHRRSVAAKVLAVTGSVGKTTTKEILYQLLSNSYLARKSLGNFNSTIGLPLQLLKLKPDDDWMVCELGMSTVGEIETLMDITKPDAALWTSVQAVHLANFDSLEGIARAKAEIVRNLEPNKTLIYNMDDPLVAIHSIKYQGRKVRYSFRAPEAEILAKIQPFADWNGTSFSIRLPNGHTYNLTLPLVGRYNAFNAVAACAAAWAVDIEPQDFVVAMRQIQPMRGRSNMMSFTQDIRVVDDTYNANPKAFHQVLRSFARLSASNYRWLICGDMLELGTEEVALHASLGDMLAQYGFDRVTLVGPLAAHTYQRLKDSGTTPQIEHFQTVEEALASLSLSVPPHARIWIKGSRGIHLERLSRRLIDHLEEAEKVS